MADIYLSSTFSDLKTYREAVYRALRQMQYNVIAMEDYVAKDQRPLDRCLADVAKCDLYIGLFAWRYGYVPAEDNPDGKSITELRVPGSQQGWQTLPYFYSCRGCTLAGDSNGCRIRRK